MNDLFADLGSDISVRLSDLNSPGSHDGMVELSIERHGSKGVDTAVMPIDLVGAGVDSFTANRSRKDVGNDIINAINAQVRLGDNKVSVKTLKIADNLGAGQ